MPNGKAVSDKDNLEAVNTMEPLHGREFLKALVRAIPDLVWLKDPEGVYLACNPKFERFFGATEAEIIGKTDYDFVDKELADFFRKNDLKAIKAKKSVMNEEEVVYADDGHSEMLETVKTPMYDSKGELIGVLGIGRDITHRKHTLDREKKINRLNEELLGAGYLNDKLNQVTQAIVDIFQADFARIWIIKPGDICEQGCPHAKEVQEPHICRFREKCLHLVASSGRYTHIDGAHGRVPFGSYKIGRIASEEDTKFLTNQVVTDPRIHHHDWAADLGLTSFAGYRLISPSGETIGVLALFSKNIISVEEDIQLENIASMIIHVVENARANAALKESEANYRSITESMVDPVYITTVGRNIVYMNSVMIERIGRDATGEKCYRAFHNQDGICEWCDFEGLENNKSVENKMVSPLDGRTYRITSMPVKGKGNASLKMSMYRDITDYLSAVDEKEKMQTQLQQAQKMEAVGMLAGGIAHDFNNILYPIIGFAEMSLEELPETNPVRENIEDILHGAKRARDLVKQILTFSRQEGKNLEFVEIRPVVVETVRLLKSILPSNINIKTDFYDGSDLVFADSGEIHEIIMNLCTNAYHSMENTGGTLTICLLKEEPSQDLNLPGKNYICLSIEDNGEGIAPEHLDNVFDPYFSTKPQGKGSGLGLSVTHGIVHSYNGAITVESELKSGTKFKIYLPLSAEKQKTEIKKKQPLQTGDESILLVDDEEHIVKLGTMLFEQLGYQITGETSSVKALETFTASPDHFDIIITDMTMPEMLGTELSRKIREIRPDIPILICSGYTPDYDGDTVGGSGIQGYISKPISVNEMSTKVREILDRNKEE